MFLGDLIVEWFINLFILLFKYIVESFCMLSIRIGIMDIKINRIYCWF